MQGCRPFTKAEFKHIVKAAKKRGWHREACWIVLGVETGFRISELLSLVTLQAYPIIPGAPPVEHLTVDKDLMKGNYKSRTVKLSRLAKAELAAYRPYAGYHFLFMSKKGGKITRKTAHERLQILCADCGIDATLIACHSMRKTFAHVWFDKLGGDLQALQKMMGHQKLKSTQSYLTFQELALWEKQSDHLRQKRSTN